MYALPLFQLLLNLPDQAIALLVDPILSVEQLASLLVTRGFHCLHFLLRFQLVFQRRSQRGDLAGHHVSLREALDEGQSARHGVGAGGLWAGRG